jgi:hypothetical protein
VVSHGGAGPGISSTIALIPQWNTFVTLQSNADMKHVANGLVFAQIMAAIGGTVVDADIDILNT